MKPTIIRETETLKRWSEQAKARNCQALDFNGYKPLISRHRSPLDNSLLGGWWCEGPHPYGFVSNGWGATPEAAYESWTNPIPF